jgi:hypothetical protein
MKYFYFLVFLVLSLAAQAQSPVITSQTFYHIGDRTIEVQVDTNTITRSIPDLGINKVWDFSTAREAQVSQNNPITRDTIDVTDPSQTPYGVYFPTSNFAFTGRIIINNTSYSSSATYYNYLHISTQGVKRVSSVTISQSSYQISPGVTSTSFDTSYALSSSQSDELLFPTSFGTATSTKHYVQRERSSRSNSIFGNSTSLSRVNSSVTVQDSFNGWGTLVFSIGSFQVLRNTLIENRIDTNYSYNNGSWVMGGISQSIDTTIRFFQAASPVDMVDCSISKGKIVNMYVRLPLITALDKQVANTSPGIYPNPATTEFIVPAQQGTQIQLWNTAGQLVLDQHLNQGEATRISTANLPRGIYQYQIIGTTSRGRLVVE